jgi:hypothetical protein
MARPTEAKRRKRNYRSRIALFAGAMLAAVGLLTPFEVVEYDHFEKVLLLGLFISVVSVVALFATAATQSQQTFARRSAIAVVVGIGAVIIAFLFFLMAFTAAMNA